MATEFLLLSNLTANSTVDLMTGADTGEADARFIQFASQVTVAIEASAVGIQLNITSGGRTIVERSTLGAGGTTGVFPNINEQAFQFLAAAGDKLRMPVTEIAGVMTTDVMATVDIEPLG